jgi:hypothetical protein
MLLFGVLAGLVAATSTAVGLEPSGNAVAVVQQAAATSGSVSRTLVREDPVFMGDQIRTGPIGEAQIRFRDQTRLVVGANSSLVIDSFVLSGEGTATSVAMRATKGAFRFISGISQSQAYAISTPSVTIGIRGTRFDFSVTPSGQTNFALFQGRARLCDRGNRCIDLSGQCSVVISEPGAGLRRVASLTEQTQLLRASFPYVVSQASLHPDFKVDVSGCNMRQALFDPQDVVPLPVSPAVALPPVPPDPPPAAPARGNPGNDRAVGNAGESPNGGNYGGGNRGRGDAGNGNGNGSGGGGNGNGNSRNR